MVLDEIKNIPSSRRDLRNFGFTIGGVLIAIGFWAALRHNSFWFEILIIGLLVAAVGSLVPSLLKPFQKIWMALAVMMGWVMTRVILLIIFSLVFTPTHFISKISGKKFLNLKIETKKDSYWIYRDQKDSSKSNLEKQF